MPSLNSSFADCLSCEIYGCPSCILETNAKTMDEVDVIIIAENPGKTECEEGRPLVGKAGKLFRKHFENFGLHREKYLLTNVVLCQTIKPDGTTGNPTDETIEKCKVNCFNIIEACNPKLIVLMGTSPCKAFGFIQKGVTITKIRGTIHKWNDYNVLPMLHPSYILRSNSEEPKFEEDMKKVAEIIKGREIIRDIKEQVKQEGKGVFYYKIPEKFYTSEFKLVDVQHLNRSGKILYIFRDKDGKKIYHEEKDIYHCYQHSDIEKAKPIVPYDELMHVSVPYKMRSTLDVRITYEGDMRLSVKHAQDYYLQKKEVEADVDLKVMFMDIETFITGKGNSSVEAASDIICVIGYSYEGNHVTYVLDPKVLKVDKPITITDGVIICKSEKELIDRFFKDLKSLDPDILTGWYIDGFDIPYIINRCRKVGISPDSMSKFGEVDVDLRYGKVFIAGIVISDLLFVYKSFTLNLRESYSLDFVAFAELGEGKLGQGYNFSTMFRESPDEAIKYNIQDVVLLPKLHNRLKHLNLQNEIRTICKESYDAVFSSMGQLDSLLLSYLKEKGLASKNADIHEKEGAFEGAFVKEPIVGIHENIVDFDFASLYPSLIITYNIGVNTFVMKLKDYQQGYDMCYSQESLPDVIDVIYDPMFKAEEVKMKKEDLLKKVKDEKLVYTINGCFFKNHDDELSYYAKILKENMILRDKYKKIALESKEKGDSKTFVVFDSKQNTYKILNNSIYGILGNNAFRFFNIDCARSITLSGQEALKTSIINAEFYVNSIINKDTDTPVGLTKEEIFTERLDRISEHVITGDTDSIFLTFKNISKNMDKEQLDDLIGKTEYFLNENIVPELVKKHNSSINSLKLKNEYVIDRGIFLAKKRYAIHIVSQEGKIVDEIKPMGLELRRSDFPSLTKEKLKELLDLLLREKVSNPVKLLRYVKETQEQFLTEIRNGSKTVSRPSSYGKNIKEYKSIPMGVRAMENWNLLEYSYFHVGSKGYLFKIQGIDLDKAPKNISDAYYKHFAGKKVKLDAIAIPEQEIKLPDYYIPDVNTMLQFCWLDRYELLLKPIFESVQKRAVLF